MVDISQDNNICKNYEGPRKVNLKKINWETFKNDLKETDVQSQVNWCEDVNGKIEAFQNLHSEIAQELAPKSERVPIHRKLSVWWNNECTVVKKTVIRGKKKVQAVPKPLGFSNVSKNICSL